LILSIQELPALNASLNACAALMLIFGFVAVKTGRVEAHKKFMGLALFFSAAFLSSYLVYHFNTAAVTRYSGEGITRWIYYLILFTHIPLAAFMVPFIIIAVVAAIRGRIESHRRLVKWVWPVWMYVSITGVIIYWMLYQ
jgi:putative membrane protein